MIFASRVGLRRKRKASAGAGRTSIGAAKERAHRRLLPELLSGWSGVREPGSKDPWVECKKVEGTETPVKIAQSNRSSDCRDRYSAHKQSCQAFGSSSARTMPSSRKWRRASRGKASHVCPRRECICQNGAGEWHHSAWRPSSRSTCASF